jgi:hypothetical protein
MQANADIFTESSHLGRPLAYSLAFHLAVVGLILLAGAVLSQGTGSGWGAGGGGDAMGATLVSTVPLPAPQVQTQNVLANDSKGLTKSQPEPKAMEEPDAIRFPTKR